MHVDGINLDLEVSNCTRAVGNCDNPTGWNEQARENLTNMVASVTAALHSAVPGSQVCLHTADILLSI